MNERMFENVYIAIWLVLSVVMLAVDDAFSWFFTGIVVLAVAYIFFDRWNRRRKGLGVREKTIEHRCSMGVMLLGLTAGVVTRLLTGHYPTGQAMCFGMGCVLGGLVALSVSGYYRERQERQVSLQSAAPHSPT